jgi:hypothetical protein
METGPRHRPLRHNAWHVRGDRADVRPPSWALGAISAIGSGQRQGSLGWIPAQDSSSFINFQNFISDLNILKFCLNFKNS